MCKVVAGKLLNSEEERVCDLGSGVDRDPRDGLDFPVFLENTVPSTIGCGTSSLCVSKGYNLLSAYDVSHFLRALQTGSVNN